MWNKNFYKISAYIKLSTTVLARSTSTTIQIYTMWGASRYDCFDLYIYAIAALHAPHCTLWLLVFIMRRSFAVYDIYIMYVEHLCYMWNSYHIVQNRTLNHDRTIYPAKCDTPEYASDSYTDFTRIYIYIYIACRDSKRIQLLLLNNILQTTEIFVFFLL